MNARNKLAALAALALLGAGAWAGPAFEWGRVDYADGSSAGLTTTNALGDATLSDADLDSAKTPTNIVFLVDETVVDQIELSDKTLTLTGDSIRLKTRGTNSVFNLSGSTGSWTVRGLTFNGCGQTLGEFAPYDGGAIQVDGGNLTLDGCAFNNFVTRFTGGAVSCLRLDGSSLVTNCTFTGNAAQPINGYGGALYATKSSTAGEVTLTVADSAFRSNSAENGGAICTLTMAYDDELPIAVAVGDGTVFTNNTAIYEGGAIIAEGALDIVGSNTVFRANRAGLSGGAICETGIVGDFEPVTVKIRQATFADNAAGTNSTWSAGGALALQLGGITLDVGDHAVFTNNVVSTCDGDEPAFGGAVYAVSGVTNVFDRVAFVGNRAENSGSVVCYGGAISAEAGCRTTVDTCVFDCLGASGVNCYGAAADFNGGRALLKNSTFRHGRVEAISTYAADVSITNCVIVGNALADQSAYSDLYLEETDLAMAYTAYGTLARSTASALAVTNNLSGRLAADVYDGDSLKLRATGFNPVAGLGLPQTTNDFANVAYGSKTCGSSMGAYETPTEKLIVWLKGTKKYDMTAVSNGCSWTWASYTNAVDAAKESYWNDLATQKEDLPKLFAITNWTFGSAEPGAYCGTNAAPFNIVAGLEPKTAKGKWLETVIAYFYEGEIYKAPVEDLFVTLTPTEYKWTGGLVKPAEVGGTDGGTLVISNLQGAVLHENEYVLSWDDNRDPCDTSGAKLIVTFTNHYACVVTNTYAITAYRTEYYTVDALTEVATNGSLSTSNVVADLSNRPAGHCVDYQRAETNAAVYVYGTGPLGAENVTTIRVYYEVDVVGGVPSGGDGVPDKYQRKVLFATVNGKWAESESGRDLYVWVTLTNATATAYPGGKWDAAGSHALTADDVPTFGRALARFEETGSWNTASGASPVGQVVTGSGAFPIYFFSPSNTVNSGHVRSGNGMGQLSVNRVSLASLDAEAEEEATDVSGLKNVLAITEFAVGENGEVAGAVEAQVLNTLSNSPLAAMPLENTAIEIWGAETLGGEWFKVYDATTDSDGVWTLSRTRTTGVRTVTRTATGDRTATLDISSLGKPRFFKVRLAE